MPSLHCPWAVLTVLPKKDAVAVVVTRHRAIFYRSGMVMQEGYLSIAPVGGGCPLPRPLLLLPFYEVVSNQVTGGAMLEPIAKLMKEAQLRYRLNGFPPKRLYRLLANGEVHFFIGLEHAPEYDGLVYSSPSPINIIRLQIYRLPTTAKLPEVQALAGKTLLVIRGYSYGGALLKLQRLTPTPIVREANHHLQALQMLQAGRADYLLDYSQAVNYTLQEMADPPKLAVKTLSVLKLHLLVSKKAPHAEALIQKLTQAMERLIARGELDSLRRYNQ